MKILFQRNRISTFIKYFLSCYFSWNEPLHQRYELSSKTIKKSFLFWNRIKKFGSFQIYERKGRLYSIYLKLLLD